MFAVLCQLLRLVREWAEWQRDKHNPAPRTIVDEVKEAWGSTPRPQEKLACESKAEMRWMRVQRYWRASSSDSI